MKNANYCVNRMRNGLTVFILMTVMVFPLFGAANQFGVAATMPRDGLMISFDPLPWTWQNLGYKIFEQSPYMKSYPKQLYWQRALPNSKRPASQKNNRDALIKPKAVLTTSNRKRKRNQHYPNN